MKQLTALLLTFVVLIFLLSSTLGEFTPDDTECTQSDWHECSAAISDCRFPCKSEPQGKACQECINLHFKTDQILCCGCLQMAFGPKVSCEVPMG